MEFDFYENLQENTQENVDENLKLGLIDESKALNSIFENPAANEGNFNFPPNFGKLGETVEHRVKRHELESNISRGLEIAAQNSLKDLKEIEEKEASKK